MTIHPADIPNKMRLIAALTRAEIPGWESAMHERGAFPGEVAAIMKRKQEVGQ